jgi:glycosyltransferase involved in cell wall biosynthesis
VSRPLHILVTADPELPVPPRFYGGIERIVELLIVGLRRRGHRITLLAHPASSVDCDRVGYRGAHSRSVASTIRNASQVLSETRRRRPDLVQSFGRLAYLAPVLPRRLPKVMSYQRAITPRTVHWADRLARGTLHFTACSARLMAPVASAGAWHVIHNGVPIARYAFTEAVPDDAPLVFLGRIEEIKGPHLAIDVARETGRRLVIAGNVPDDHRAYFERTIAPHVDGRAVTFVGPVDDAEKDRLLGSAAALLMPVLWEEPFGIVMAEALACGTPVIGLARGAVPEVVDDGVTGFVCEDVRGMVQAVGRVSRLSRQACRSDAERRFSDTAIVDAYERLYREVVAA